MQVACVLSVLFGLFDSMSNYININYKIKFNFSFKTLILPKFFEVLAKKMSFQTIFLVSFSMEIKNLTFIDEGGTIRAQLRPNRSILPILDLTCTPNWSFPSVFRFHSRAHSRGLRSAGFFGNKTTYQMTKGEWSGARASWLGPGAAFSSPLCSLIARKK